MRCGYCNQEFDGVGVLDRRDTGRLGDSPLSDHGTETVPVWFCPACAARRTATRVGFWLFLAALVLGAVLIAAIAPLVRI